METCSWVLTFVSEMLCCPHSNETSSAKLLRGTICFSRCYKIAQFRYFKIQLETKDITTRLRGLNHINLLYYSPKPCSDVF